MHILVYKNNVLSLYSNLLLIFKISIMEQADVYAYFDLESPFIKYFNRCKDIDMTKSQIQKNLNFLDKYYQNMVIDKLPITIFFKIEPSLEKLFNNWCVDNNII